MSRALSRAAAALGAALFLAAIVLILLVPGRGEPRELSVFSTEDEGLRALYLALGRVGLPVRPWSAPPGELAGPGTVLVLASVPEAPTALPDAPGEAAPRRGRDLAHYRRFVEEGGTLLVLGADRRALDELEEELGFAELAKVLSSRLQGDEQGAALVGGERVELPDDAAERALRGDGLEALATSPGGEAVVAARALGAGRLVLATLPAESLSNEELARDGAPALFLVRVLEALGPAERVLFDEYALGGWRPAPVTALALSPRLAWLTLHALLLLLVLGWRAAWVGPFPRDPEPLLAASPLARARGFGSLLARAGRFELLARLLRRGVLARLEARAGSRAAHAAPDTDGTPPKDAGPDDARLAALAPGDERLRARLASALRGPAPADEAGLAALERELAALEDALATPHARKTRRGVGARASRSGS